MHRFAYRSRAQLLEIPVATTRLFPTNLTAGGGQVFLDAKLA
ncbi:MAG TPA: hypothetical protein VML57_19165 [Burkholderiales bacterium]|nr:hypothetical protein [Burkholderiales bacterium]